MGTEGVIPYTVIQVVAQLDNIYQARLLGWVLAKAQSVIKQTDRNLKEINLQHVHPYMDITIPARFVLAEGEKNYHNIEKAISLARKTVRHRIHGIDYQLNIITNPSVYQDRGVKIRFSVHHLIWHLLLDFSKGWRFVDLQAAVRLKTVAEVSLYFLVSGQKNPIRYSIDTLKAYTGHAGMKGYERSSNYINRVLIPTRERLSEAAPYTFDFTAEKNGRAFSTILLAPRINQGYQQPGDKRKDEIQLQRIRLDARVVDYIRYSFDARPADIEKVEALILRLDPSPMGQLNQLSRILDYAILAKAQNKFGYLVNALKNHPS